MRRTTRAGALLLMLIACLAISTALAHAQDPAPTEGTNEEAAGEEADPCADLRPWEQPACWVREGLSSGVNSIVAVGFGSVFDQLYEWVASGAAWLLGQLVSLIDSSTRPQVGADWFTSQYRLMGSLAVVLVLPLLLVSSIVGVARQDWRGLVKSYFVYLPAAMIGTAIAIPLVDMGLEITDWMSSLFLGGMREDIEGFADGVAGALLASPGTAAAAANAGVAPFLMFMAASVIALGAFAVWVELVLRAAGIYVALFFLPLGFAALVWPSTRKWFGRLVKALVALVLSKFVIVAVIALASAALGNLATGEGDGSAVGGMIAGSALMLMAAFSPLALFRLADVAGDEMASAIEGVTQHRTSPVPTPAPQQSASKLYGRIMQSRTARDTAPATVAGQRASVMAGGGTTVAGAPAAAATGVAPAVKAPKAAGERAGQGLAGVVEAGEQRTPARAEPPDGQPPGHSPGNGRATLGGPDVTPPGTRATATSPESGVGPEVGNATESRERFAVRAPSDVAPGESSQPSPVNVVPPECQPPVPPPTDPPSTS